MKTRTELYEQLKTLAPTLARGKSRARREELLTLLTTKTAVEVGALAPPKPELNHAEQQLRDSGFGKPAPKPKKRKPKKKTNLVVAAHGLSAEDGMVLRRVIYSMENAGKLLNDVSIGISGVAALLSISTGHQAETVQRVLEGLLTAPKDFGAA